MKIFAAENPDLAVRSESSSGGVFSILANNVLAEGGSVFGATFNENWEVVHIGVVNTTDLKRLRGSKYVYSDFMQAVKQAEDALQSGREVLFSGCPCQVAVMRKKFPDNPNLLLVDVVCHGAPEDKYWSLYLDSLLATLDKSRGDIESISFRDKKTGWKHYSFTIKFKDGSEFTEKGYDNLYMKAFLSDLTLREGCFKCPFKYPDGCKSDITLGDLWGIGSLAPQIDNNLGTTLVIASTQKGIDTVRNIPALAEFTLSEVSKYNPSITTPSKCCGKYRKFKKNSNKYFTGCKTSHNQFLKFLCRETKLSMVQKFKSRLKNIYRKCLS